MGDVNKKSPDVIGAAFTEGSGLGIGTEMHVEWGETKTVYSMNIFDMWDSFYETIDIYK